MSKMKTNSVVKIGLTGGIRSGKDTVAEYLVELIPRYYVNQDPTLVMGFADGIKDLFKTFLPDLLEGGKPRKAYQEVGQMLRKFDQDVWVKYALNTLELHQGVYPNTHVIFKDVRQPNEVEALREQGFTIVKVIARTEDRIERMEANGDVFNIDDLNHETEKAIDGITPDVVIYNTGTLEDLYYTVEDFLLDYQHSNIEGE